jgi:hypothetical protein
MNKPSFFPRNMFAVFVVVLIFAGISCGAPMSAGVPETPAASAPEPTEAMAPATEPAEPAAAPAPDFTQPVVSPTSQPTQAVAPISEPTQIAMVAAPAIPESRRLTLEFPSKMRAGVEGDVVRLTLEVDNLGNIIPTAEIAGNKVMGETIEIPDLYETHNVTAEARLDMAGMLIQPPDAIYEPLKRGQSATFYWSIRPEDAGKYRGTVWLHLNFSDKSTGEQSRIAVSAQIIEIEAVDFFGLSANFARTSGVIGSIVGGVVGFPFIEDIFKFLFKRRKRP